MSLVINVKMEKCVIDYQNLRCDSCSNYLSFFPILITSNFENFCGRCAHQKNNRVAQRNKIYESVANVIKFPCCHEKQGCVKRLLPSEVPEHEKNCNFRQTSCIKKYCLWRGASSELVAHCKELHQELFLHENVEYKVPFRDGTKKHLLFFQENVLTIKWQYLKSKSVIKCAIFPLGNEVVAELPPLQLCLESKKIIYPFELTLSNVGTANFTSVDLKKLKNPPNAPHCLVKLSFRKSEINWKLLEVLKCADCTTYVLPPIFQPSSSAIFCSKCLRQKKAIDVKKNYSLTGLSDLLCYPCKNYSNGCTFTNRPVQVEKHQSRCALNIIVCPLFEFGICAWIGQRKKFYDHIDACHRQYVKSINDFSVNIKENKVLLGIIKFSHCYFRMVYTKKLEKYYWSVEPIDVEDAQDFAFEIEIYETETICKKLVMRQPCGQMLDGTSLFHSYWSLSKEQICPLIKCDIMTFKVNIFQIDNLK